MMPHADHPRRRRWVLLPLPLHAMQSGKGGKDQPEKVTQLGTSDLCHNPRLPLSFASRQSFFSRHHHPISPEPCVHRVDLILLLSTSNISDIISPTSKMAPANTLPAWSDLQAHRDSVGKSFVLKEAFASDPDRFDRFTRTFKAEGSNDILFDFSKNFLTDETLDLLVKLAEQAGVEKKRDAMFAGEKINFTEDRAVYHTALRNVGGWEMKVDGVDVTSGVNEVLDHMKEFSEQVRSGEWKGYTGKKLTTIINVGIGGSDL